MIRLSTIVALIYVALSVGCNRGNQNPSRQVMGGGHAVSGKLAVSNGPVIQLENHPGILFAFVTKPNRPKALTYCVVFNHDFPAAAFNSMKTSSTSDGTNAGTSHTIRAFGATCNVEYQVTLADDGETVAEETTFVGGNSYDPSQGKLFLIDMKSNPVAVTQVDLDLPSAIPDMQEVEAAEKFGLDTLKGLREASETVDAFCRTTTANSR
jgi:hypothetical protein